MARIHLFHTHKEERQQRVVALEGAGHSVSVSSWDPELFKALKEDPPEGFVIDLERLPSHGRDVALQLRLSVPTRHVPLVFAGGQAEKVIKVRELLPDAVFVSWAELTAVLPAVIAHPPANPIVPKSAMAGYSGTPLPKKLGIKPGMTVGLVSAPGDFDATLGDLPDSVTLKSIEGPDAAPAAEWGEVSVWFVRDLVELEGGMAAMVPAGAGTRRLWIAWPKKASKLASDVTQAAVRQTGLATGLVDFKIAAIDKTWSGLCFTERKNT